MDPTVSENPEIRGEKNLYKTKALVEDYVEDFAKAKRGQWNEKVANDLVKFGKGGILCL